MGRVVNGLIGFLVCGTGSVGPVLADQGWEGQRLSATWENDVLTGTDRHYTQGASIAYWSRDDALPGWLAGLSSHLPAVGLDYQAEKWGLGISQEIYTPEDLRSRAVVANERPYAGWLFGSAGLQRHGQWTRSWWSREQFSLDLGVIGPESLADDTQKTWHHVSPAGWENQLKTEPGFVLGYERAYLYRRQTANQHWAVDVLPEARARAGNVAAFFGAGAALRFGYRIPNEFDAPGKPTPCHWGAYGFTGVEGRWILRNLFLDGNTFTDSHHVHKEPLVGDWTVGLSFVLKRVEVRLAHTFRTREFERQSSRDSFSSATVNVKF
jgi:hypothetical protein